MFCCESILLMDSPRPRCLIDVEFLILGPVSGKILVKVAAPAVAYPICIIRGRTNRNSFGSPTIQIAKQMCKLLDLVRRETGKLVVDDDVVCRFRLGNDGTGVSGKTKKKASVSKTHGSFQGCMRLQVEIPTAFHCDASIDDRAVERVAVVHRVHFAWCRRIEAGMMTLADDDNGDSWHVFRAAEFSTRFLDCFELCF